MHLSEAEKQEIIHRLLSEFQYYKIETNGRWPKSLHKACSTVGLVKPKVFEFYIRQPDSQIIYEANLLYNRVLHFYRFSDFYTAKTIDSFLRKHIVECQESRDAEQNEDLDPVYYWTDLDDQKVEAYSNAIETIKIKMYNNSDAPSKQVEEIRADLRKSQMLYNELLSRKHQFNYLTVESIASKMYARFLYGNTFYNAKKEQVRGLPNGLLDNIADIVRSGSISGTKMREISHTSPWLQYYKTSQSNIFNGMTLSNDILQLTSLTRWYEFVRELPTEQRPKEHVIDDNDMLDGWYILWEREQKNKSEKTLIESSKFNVETFVMAKTAEEADLVWQKNNKAAQGILKNRAKQVFSSSGGVKNQDLHDVRFDINVGANLAAINATRNN